MSDNNPYPKTPAGRVAWVTGAGTGIGRTLARRLAREGWQVAVSARTKEDLDSLAAEVPGQIHAFPLDVTNGEPTRNTVTAIEAKLGPLDLAVLNAGTYRRESATRFDAEAFGVMVDVNIMGSVHSLAAVLPGMIERRSGRIAVVGSVSGYTGLPGAAGYGATKAALIAMCEALHPELQAHNVQLSIINPGFVDTPLTRKNDFPMPFIISMDKAVDHIMNGLKSKRFEIAFPWQMVLATKLLAALPARLRFAVTRRMVRH
ncbi:MAG TPA: SDR family NAD(P)-dependent oxidoreductase [Aurantimonas sp.]|uniref:SDR family NAD(P)-dependent oxidoreductase n=1 Tax=Aurantimonas marianensis TaxID=2920428 RepID=A0A9X2KFR5_9HYPH|nr:SDR family NAD(P)-dependent oxidoreductase [Aurantimonas marianensis]MCP3056079.1 SDR family NAD(P)-dependent oxidoreductase [Aurantimonas marianensis]